MDESTNVLDRNFEILRIDTKNTMLTFVPAPLLGREVPPPGPHLTSGKRDAAALFALLELQIRSFELGRPFGNATFEFQIQAFQFAGLSEQFGENPHFGA